MPAIFITALGFLKNLPWKYIGIALALLFVVREIERFGYHERDHEVAGLHDMIKARDKTIADLKAASDAAAALNKSQVHTEEAAQATHTQDTNHDDTIRKAAADDAFDAYKRLHSIPDRSASSPSSLPPRTDPAGSAVEADPNAGIHDAVVVSADDLLICKDAVLKGQSFDAWWPGAAKIINDAADAHPEPPAP